MEFVEAKSMLNRVDGSQWFGNEYNMNIYRGCCHGCVYCDSRSDCYQVEDFDTVRAKKDSLAILRRELRSKQRSAIIGTGSMSDPYNPFERDHKFTQGALKLIAEFGFGLTIITKSDLIVRDISLLKSIRQNAPLLVKMTITTIDDELCKVIEPNVSLSSERFQAIKALSDEGIYTGILLMPVLPFLEDTEENILGIVRKAHESGAKFIYPMIGMTLRQNQKDWYYQKLDQHFPGVKKKYMDAFGDNYQCFSPRWKELSDLLKRECDRYGLIYRMEEIIKGYQSENACTQLSLFDLI